MSVNNGIEISLMGQSGTGSFAGSVSPSFQTPDLGTVNSGNLANCSNYAVTALSGMAAETISWLTNPTSINLANMISAKTGTGSLVFGTGPSISGALMLGTATNDNAPPGSIGEFIELIIPATSAINMTSGITANLGFLPLTPGDWQVWGSTWFQAASLTALNYMRSAISLVSSTFPTSPANGAYSQLRVTLSTGATQGLFTGMSRISIANAANVYLLGYSEFTLGLLSTYGYIAARRMR